jgi:hypothetical protein
VVGVVVDAVLGSLLMSVPAGRLRAGVLSRSISAFTAATICCLTPGGISLACVFLTASLSVRSQSASLWPSVPHMRTFDCLGLPSTICWMVVSNLCASQFWASAFSGDGCSCGGADCFSGAATAAAAAATSAMPPMIFTCPRAIASHLAPTG